MKRKILFGRVRAVGWVLATVACLVWFPDSIVYVIIASGYANALTDLSVAEAADDRAVLARIAALEQRIKNMDDSQ